MDPLLKPCHTFLGVDLDEKHYLSVKKVNSETIEVKLKSFETRMNKDNFLGKYIEQVSVLTCLKNRLRSVKEREKPSDQIFRKTDLLYSKIIQNIGLYPLIDSNKIKAVLADALEYQLQQIERRYEDICNCATRLKRTLSVSPPVSETSILRDSLFAPKKPPLSASRKIEIPRVQVLDLAAIELSSSPPQVEVISPRSSTSTNHESRHSIDKLGSDALEFLYTKWVHGNRDAEKRIQQCNEGKKGSVTKTEKDIIIGWRSTPLMAKYLEIKSVRYLEKPELLTHLHPDIDRTLPYLTVFGVELPAEPYERFEVVLTKFMEQLKWFKVAQGEHLIKVWKSYKKENFENDVGAFIKNLSFVEAYKPLFHMLAGLSQKFYAEPGNLLKDLFRGIQGFSSELTKTTNSTIKIKYTFTSDGELEIVSKNRLVTILGGSLPSAEIVIVNTMKAKLFALDKWSSDLFLHVIPVDNSKAVEEKILSVLHRNGLHADIQMISSPRN